MNIRNKSLFSLLFYSILANENVKNETLENIKLSPNADMICDEKNPSICVAVDNVVVGPVECYQEMRGYYSYNGGQNWTQGTNAFTWDYLENTIYDFQCSQGDNLTFCAAVGFRQDSGHGDGTGMVFYTQNGGFNWTKKAAPMCVDGVFSYYFGYLTDIQVNGQNWTMQGYCTSDEGEFNQTGATNDAGNHFDWDLTPWKRYARNSDVPATLLSDSTVNLKQGVLNFGAAAMFFMAMYFLVKYVKENSIENSNYIEIDEQKKPFFNLTSNKFSLSQLFCCHFGRNNFKTEEEATFHSIPDHAMQILNR